MPPAHWYIILSIASFFCFSDAEVLIKSVKSGLVFDGNEKNVKAVKPDNSEGQKWILERQKSGQFFIVNAKNHLAMDLQKGCGIGHNIIIYQKKLSDNQLFNVNCDGTIESACDKNFILQIKNGNVETVAKAEAVNLDVHFKIVEVK